MPTIYRIFFMLFVFTKSVIGLDLPEIERRWNQEADKPINCFLHFIDQNNLPVSNVDVLARVYIRKFNAPLVQIASGSFKTGKDGSLIIQGFHGSRLWIKLDDNVMASGSTAPFQEGGIGLNYSTVMGVPIDDSGTAEKPRSIRMWRRQGKQKLIALNGEVVVHFNGKPISINLVDGKVNSEKSDLIIDITQPMSPADIRMAEESISAGSNRLGVFPWSCKVSIVDGGFYTPDDKDFYNRIFGVYDFPLITEKTFNSNGFQNTVDMKICFCCRRASLNGKIRIIIKSGSENRHGDIPISIIDGLMNNSMSKSLEIDPSKIIKINLTLPNP